MDLENKAITKECCICNKFTDDKWNPLKEDFTPEEKKEIYKVYNVIMGYCLDCRKPKEPEVYHNFAEHYQYTLEGA